MFGMLRPCRNRLSPRLRTDWTAHLCGMCLALRDRHGHLARLVTNYDGLVLSALVEAQRPAAGSGPGAAAGRRRAGPCALRGFRGAEVSQGEGALLAASASLLLASAQLRDHVADGDLVGAVRTRAASRVADRWAAAGEASSGGLGLDVGRVRAAVARQGEVERVLVEDGPGADPVAALLAVTAPTEEASAEGLRATAVVAGRPGNAASLAEAGRLFGRVAHLLDAVEDLADDRAAGRFNPVLATGLGPAQVRAVCDDAVLGVRLALAEVELDDPALVHLLLLGELPRAVARTFAAAATEPPAGPGVPDLPPEWKPAPGGESDGHGPSRAAVVEVTGCLAALAACGTCRGCRDGGAHGRRRRKKKKDKGDCCGDGGCGDCTCDCCCDGCGCDC
jgi:hypothetical protein